MRNDLEQLKRSLDVLIAIMEDWSHWQQGYRMKIGYPSCSAGFQSGGSVSEESETSPYERSEDYSAMLAVDAVVQEDLAPIERAAILRRYGVAAVFRFPRENYEDVLLRAHERLMVLLPRKGIVVL